MVIEVRKRFHNKVGGFILSGFNNYYQDTPTKTVCGFGEGMETYFNGIKKEVQKDPQKCDQFIFLKGEKAIQ